MLIDTSDKFYDGISENTDALLKKAKIYVDLALDQGDAIHLEKPNQLVIDIRLKKKKDVSKDNK